MRLEADLSLGEFGDVRLDKGGRRFSVVCFARAASACVRLHKQTGLRTCAFGGL